MVPTPTPPCGSTVVSLLTLVMNHECHDAFSSFSIFPSFYFLVLAQCSVVHHLSSIILWGLGTGGREVASSINPQEAIISLSLSLSVHIISYSNKH